MVRVNLLYCFADGNVEPNGVYMLYNDSCVSCPDLKDGSLQIRVAVCMEELDHEYSDSGAEKEARRNTSRVVQAWA